MFQVNFTISACFVLVGVYYGMGRHNKSLDQYHEIQALKYQALATATYISNMMFIKFSIGMFLLRLSTQKRYTYAIYGSIVIVGIWSTVLFFWNLFQCNPVAAQWDLTILENDSSAWCVGADQVVSAAYALSAMSVLSDWFYALIPVPMVWNVKMTRQAKTTVIVVLALGVFASVATLVRLKFLADLTELEDLLCKFYISSILFITVYITARLLINPLIRYPTNLVATTDAMVWTLIEPGVAIMASSLATIRPLLRAWRVRGFQSTENSNSKRTGPSYGYGRSRSRSQGIRSGHGAMPGFGSQSGSRGGAIIATTTVDIESGYVGGKSATASSNPSMSTSPLPTTITFDIHDKKQQQQQQPPARLSRITERTVDSPDLLGTPKSRCVEVRSQVFIIEGARAAAGGTTNNNYADKSLLPMPTRDPWPFIESASSSDLELTRMEPVHTQTDGGVGLGSPTRPAR
jgi:hypothetical protein